MQVLITLRHVLAAMNNSVVIAASCGLDDEEIGVRIPAGDISFFHNVQTGSGAYPASYQWVEEIFFPGVKCLSRVAYHSLP